MEKILLIRNAVIGFLYKNVLKKIFFLSDPENIHNAMTQVGVFLGKYAATRTLTQWLFDYKNPILHQEIHGITFENPLGLSAGFDKNAQMIDIMPCVGFGFEEIGSITGEPCEGNPRPRLWRLPNSEALVVYYGLKNDGAQAISQRLTGKPLPFPIGVSVAKTNCQETCDTQKGIADYVKAFTLMKDIGHYMTINISCPNTFGGEPFTDPQKLESLLAEIDKIETQKPIFLKISPDISDTNLDEIIDIVSRHRIHGFVCTNLTKKRDNPLIKDQNVPAQGGISGHVVEDLANRMIKYVYQKTNGKYIIIGAGGIFTGEDAYKKIRLGASLLNLITGMIFRGPQTISDINMRLAELLKKDGFTSISQAIGVDAKT